MGNGAWAFSHVIPKGDLAHVFLFGVFGAFSLLGMLAIDARKQRVLGAAEWRWLARRTSFVPFAALAAGGSRSSSRKINLFRLGAAAGLYVGFLMLHEHVIGVSPFPPL